MQFRPRRLADLVLDRSVVIGYSRLGYVLRHPWWRGYLPGALTGRTIAVTGANAGLGLAIAKGAATMGAEVRMLCRDEARAQAARREIYADRPDADVHIDLCDISSFASVRAVAERLTARAPTLHGLVHNAGVLPARRSESVDGHELTLATHVLGPHLLTSLLLPSLRADGDARVVYVSSGGMYAQALDMDDVQYRRGEYSGVVAYARTKRMQVVLADQTSFWLGQPGVSVHSMHPGWAATPGLSSTLPQFERIMRPLLRSPEQGADTVLWLLKDDEPIEYPGSFWHDRHRRPFDYLPFTRTSAQAAEALWQLCESVVDT